jgi:hypothetical protein
MIYNTIYKLIQNILPGLAALVSVLFVSTILWVGVVSPQVAYAEQVALDFSIDKRAIFNIKQSDLPITLETKQVPAEFVGQQCQVRAESLNNSSVHPGNNLTVSSNNGASVVLSDVERETDLIVVASGEMELGTDVTVAITAVGGSVFSGGLSVKVACPDPEPVQRCDATTGEVVTVTEDEAAGDTDRYLPADDAACQPEEITVQRCDATTGEVVTVTEDEAAGDTDRYLPADDAACQPEGEVAGDSDDRPVTLPVTGPGALAAIFTGTSVLGAAAHALFTRRRLF